MNCTVPPIPTPPSGLQLAGCCATPCVPTRATRRVAVFATAVSHEPGGSLYFWSTRIARWFLDLLKRVDHQALLASARSRAFKRPAPAHPAELPCLESPSAVHHGPGRRARLPAGHAWRSCQPEWSSGTRSPPDPHPSTGDSLTGLAPPGRQRGSQEWNNAIAAAADDLPGRHGRLRHPRRRRRYYTQSSPHADVIDAPLPGHPLPARVRARALPGDTW